MSDEEVMGAARPAGQAAEHPAVPTAEPIRLIDEHGRRAADDRAAGFELPDAGILLDLYRRMVIARRFDVQVSALTRQGRLATYPSALGQEACEIGATAALADSDWLFPTYRDSIALLTRGVQPAQVLSFFRGDWHSAFDPSEHHVAPQVTPLATQALHAVGFAMAAKLRNEPTATLTFLGDGATSEGDAHEAFNFAAVWQTPTVFVIQNNGYAISVPFAKQSHARTLADKAIGYGMPGHFVDGNDIAAVYAVVTDSLTRARRGEGPTMIEGLTYRMEAHTNSDDPTRYRTDDEVERWRVLDPISRLESYLSTEGVLTEELRSEIVDAAEQLAASTRDAMNESPHLDPLELFDHVYASPRASLAEQRAYLADELAASGSPLASAAETRSRS
ncbi:pyruvate dehydrogenase (acetyl-transferring) E1 component subunit alpha [Humibacter sp.]|uniref:pyruvate dehydrogenase (acetyl-transferring) E1 component subunit alpha n=1 Tax=Humibacter sp. TaxID=1940291 RepID=UPI003F811B45